MDIRKALTGADSLLNRLGLGYSVPKSSKGIHQLRSELNKGGIQQSSRFAVQLTPPAPLEKVIDERRLTLRCFSATLPGKQLMIKDDIARYGFGEIDRMPHNTMYTPVNASFILDSDGKVRKLFHAWMLLIQNATYGDEQNGDEYLIEYKNRYSTTITIDQYNAQNEPVTRCQLFKAFPYAMGDTQLGWDQQNALEVLPITFAYNSYKTLTAS